MSIIVCSVCVVFMCVKQGMLECVDGVCVNHSDVRACVLLGAGRCRLEEKER